MPGGLFTALIIAIHIYVIYEVFTRRDLEINTKLLWTLLVILVPIIGVIIYLLAGRFQKDTR